MHVDCRITFISPQELRAWLFSQRETGEEGRPEVLQPPSWPRSSLGSGAATFRDPDAAGLPEARNLFTGNEVAQAPASPNLFTGNEAVTRSSNAVRQSVFNTFTGIGRKHSFHQSSLRLFSTVRHFLSLHNRDCNHVDDVADLRASLKDVNRL